MHYSIIVINIIILVIIIIIMAGPSYNIQVQQVRSRLKPGLFG